MNDGADAMHMRFDEAGVQPNPFVCNDSIACACYDDAGDAAEKAVDAGLEAEYWTRCCRMANARAAARKASRAAASSRTAADRVARRALRLEQHAMELLEKGGDVDEADEYAGIAVAAASLADDAVGIFEEAVEAAEHAIRIARL